MEGNGRELAGNRRTFEFRLEQFVLELDLTLDLNLVQNPGMDLDLNLSLNSNSSPVH